MAAKISKGMLPLSPMPKKQGTSSHDCTLISRVVMPCSKRISWLRTKNSFCSGCRV
ncbi:DUF3982 domain-containing protein [Sinomicrobium pectinilyticum]|uniref:DUF3982 domain-containing protein n=1 Tax=Sinomicrobium pectinilyticum TaxID=1084421 RepID=A0A3N0ECR5_SINP1|nr:DUF3982 domain-containing protein [Sinomicrobium pectinilyticum]